MSAPALAVPPAAILPDEPDASGIVTCPMCHTPSPLTRGAVAAGGAWRCIRCGQHWEGGRLAAVAAYDAWGVACSSPRRTAGQEGKNSESHS
jgi:hypothetical protein